MAPSVQPQNALSLAHPSLQLQEKIRQINLAGIEQAAVNMYHVHVYAHFSIHVQIPVCV